MGFTYSVKRSSALADKVFYKLCTIHSHTQHIDGGCVEVSQPASVLILNATPDTFVMFGPLSSPV